MMQRHALQMCNDPHFCGWAVGGVGAQRKGERGRSWMDGEGERGGAVTGERSGDQGRKGRVLGEQGHFY